MSRLIPEWIQGIPQEAPEYERRLYAAVGTGLNGITAHACSMAQAQLEKALKSKKVAVVPVTSGQGKIEYFAQALAAVAGAMGANAHVTTAADVNGVYEALTAQADIALMADDDRFIAWEIHSGKAAENNLATATVYAAALDLMAGGLSGKKVLLLGCGPVGLLALKELQKRGAIVSVLEQRRERAQKAMEMGAAKIENASQIKAYKYIYDATNTGGWLTSNLLSGSVAISAPGVPLSLDKAALERHGERLVHDPLQLGTAMMLGMLCRSGTEGHAG